MKADFFDTMKKVNLDNEYSEKDSENSFSHDRNWESVLINVGGTK